MFEVLEECSKHLTKFQCEVKVILCIKEIENKKTIGIYGGRVQPIKDQNERIHMEVLNKESIPKLCITAEE